MTTKSAHGRVEALDLLRLFAALSVVAFHYCFRGAAADDMTWLWLPAAVPVAKYGFLGVELFFVISGFVIAYSAEGRNLREFVVARAARIYPGFLVVMTATFLVVLAFGAPRYQTSLVQWLANLAIVAPALKQPFMDGVYWSIVYELVFYAWVAATIATGWFPRRLPLIVVAWLAISLANEFGLESNAVRRMFITDGSGFFAAGLMLYALFSGRRDAITWLLLAVATVIAILQGNGDADWTRNHFGIDLSVIVVAALSVAAVGLVGAALLVRRLPIPASVLLAAGGVTYPLYLLHQTIGFIAFNRLQGLAPPVILVIATVSVMIALSYAIYRYVERPGQKLMRLWLSRLLRLEPRPASTRAPGHRLLDVPVYGPVRLARAAIGGAPEGAAS
jgi:peptidoglycan/LPS O-acetylase OafA/YrhL